MDSSITLALITFVGGGGLVSIFGIPYAIKKAKAEAKKADSEADNQAIAPLKQALDIVSAQLQTSNDRLREKDEVIARQNEEVTELRNSLTALYDDMCVHKGCKLRRPHQGQGRSWYKEHRNDPSLGCDYLSIETLLKKWRKEQNEDKPDNNGDQG